MTVAPVRRAYVAAAAALVLSGVIVSADAHIGSSHSPYTTDGPDLTSVEINDRVVDFCFDEEVIGTLTPGDFSLIGYDSETANFGDSASLSADRDECVEVNFTGPLDDNLFTIGSVAAGGVETRSGNPNLTGSAALTGSEAVGGRGRTTAPNLVDFDVDTGAGEITYVFDQEIDCPGAPGPGFAGVFGYYNQAGQGGPGGVEHGDTTADCDGNEVTIGFSPPGVANVELVFVDDAGSQLVCGFDADLGGGDCTKEEGAGSGDTDSPDLVSAERTGDDSFTFTFDEDVTANTEDSFYVYAEDGTEFFGDSGSCNDDNEEVECDFAGVGDSLDKEFVLAGVKSGAAGDAADPTYQNTIGSAPLEAGSVAPGFSDGPDLETCSVDPSRDEATLVFDEPIDETTAKGASKFGLFDAGGELTSGDDVADSSGGSLVIEFDPDAIADAVGCQVAFGAVQDFIGSGAPPASVGLPGAGPSPDPDPSGRPPQCDANPTAICGSSGNDSLHGTPGNDVFYGGAGDDVIDGQGGDDQIYGGDGNDTLYGNEGKDKIVGGNGDDIIIGGPDADSLTGGGGADKVIGDDRAKDAQSRSDFRAAQEAAGPDTIDGGGGNDSIQGGGGGDKVEGGGGADKVAGQDGADKVHAGGDEDVVAGGAGADKMWGEKGNDKLKGEEGDDVLYGGDGANDFNGGPGRDKCILDSKKDETTSCEVKQRSFQRSFMPLFLPPM